MKVNILGLTPDEFTKIIVDSGEKKFRADQILQWIYEKRVLSFNEMTSLSIEFREKLETNFSFASPFVLKKNISTDGSVKYLLELSDSNTIEMVIIPNEGKNTLCVSSQVGCSRGCYFCATAKMGLIRNLLPEEIIGQILLAVRELGEKSLTNIVFMGMGEPLDNFDNLIKSMRILQHPMCLGFSPRKTTISTSGNVPGIRKLTKEKIKVKLAVSLNAATDEKRDKIMPINKKYPLAELKKTLQEFAHINPFRITFEYVMIKKFNMETSDIKAIRKFIADLPSKLNLIAWNPVEGIPFEAPSQNEIEAFQKELMSLPQAVTFRKSRGSDIGGACGQLSGSYKTK
ncbi:MAG: 23S rRNA (adenine(2503)-C(2))-methyltransferase RlmN [Candidatus Cloacimonetes bacterium]|nr:23S rRNA (adenine(2503)-C(2))-methyltransferase RlmN [Candidatus Cloacimonadota bacterium]